MKPSYKKLEWIEILRYLAGNWKNIVIVTFAISLVAAAISLFLPNEYKSTANLLPNKKHSLGMGFLANNGGGLSSLASTVFGQQDQQADRYYVLLQSYTTSKRVIDHFDLTHVYETAGSNHPILDAMGVLADNTTFEAKDEGNFVISTWDTDPERAKEMADYYVQILNELNTQIATREAREFRTFIEKRYRQSQADLDSLQNRFAAYQKKYGIFELPAQVSEYFSMLAGITTKKVEAEVQLQLLQQTVRKGSDTYRQAQARYEAVSQKLQQLYHDGDPDNIVLNFEELPEAGKQYFELKKDLEIETQIQKFLVPLYEQSKMEEAKSLPIVSVVDQPVVPTRKDRPHRSIIVILAALSTGILCCIYYIVKLSLQQNRDYIAYIRD